MEAAELKEKFHRFIDNIENKALLESLYETLIQLEEQATEKDILDELTQEQRQELEESLKQSYEGKVIPDFVVREEVRRWLSK